MAAQCHHRAKAPLMLINERKLPVGFLDIDVMAWLPILIYDTICVLTAHAPGLPELFFHVLGESCCNWILTIDASEILIVVHSILPLYKLYCFSCAALRSSSSYCFSCFDQLRRISLARQVLLPIRLEPLQQSIIL